MVAIYEWDIKIKGNNDSTIIFDAHIISQIWSYLQTSGPLVKKDIEHGWGPLGCQESHIRQWQARNLLTRSGAYSTDAQSLPVDFKKLSSRQEHHLILLQGPELISMGYMFGLNGRVTLLTLWTFTLWDLCDLISGAKKQEVLSWKTHWPDDYPLCDYVLRLPALERGFIKYLTMLVSVFWQMDFIAKWNLAEGAAVLGKLFSSWDFLQFNASKVHCVGTWRLPST